MMEETPIKELLHQTIEKINDENLLMAIYTILSSGRQDDNYEFEVSDERLAMLKERESKFLRGEDKAHTLKQVKDKIQAKYGF
jgi:hypothetical protein